MSFASEVSWYVILGRMGIVRALCATAVVRKVIYRVLLLWLGNGIYGSFPRFR